VNPYFEFKIEGGVPGVHLTSFIFLATNNLMNKHNAQWAKLPKKHSI